MAKKLEGFVHVGVQTSIFHPDGVQRDLATPLKSIYAMLKYLIFGHKPKFGEISILATFCYNFMHKNNVFFIIVFDLKVVFTISWNKQIKFESI